MRFAWVCSFLHHVTSGDQTEATGLGGWLAPLPGEPFSGAKYQIVHKKNMMWSWSRYHKADINACKQGPFFTASSSIGNNKSWSKALCTLVRKQDPPLKITSVLEIALEAVRYQNDPVKPSAHFSTPTHDRAPPAPASPPRLGIQIF